MENSSISPVFNQMRNLDSNSAGGQFLFHGSNASKVPDNCCLKLALWFTRPLEKNLVWSQKVYMFEFRTSGAEILPENGMVEVPTTVELQCSVQPYN